MEQEENKTNGKDTDVLASAVREFEDKLKQAKVALASAKGQSTLWGVSKDKLVLAGAIIIAAIIISLSIVLGRGGGGNSGLPVAGDTEQGAKIDVSADDDPFLGDDDADITVIEFSDYQCPFCRTFWSQTLPQLKTDYIDTGKVKFVYRDYPLPFHPAAEISALAANCAGEQNKYWEMHDKLFSEQQKQGTGTITYGEAELKQWASQIGLNSSKFNSCLDSKKYQSEVQKDLADGSSAGVNGTPTFFINGRMLVGAQPFSAFQTAIDAEL